MVPSPLADLVSSGMLLDMVLGMLLGMAASPLAMKGIRAVRRKRKLDKVLHEIAESRKSGNAPTKNNLI